MYVCMDNYTYILSVKVNPNEYECVLSYSLLQLVMASVSIQGVAGVRVAEFI